MTLLGMGFFAVTEKSYLLKDKLDQLTFVTDKSVTKNQFKSMFSKRFSDLKILGISSMIANGKTRRFRGKNGKRSDKKKFIIRVPAGSVLDLEKI